MAFCIGNNAEEVCLPKMEIVPQSERFTYQAPWKVSSFSAPQEGNIIPEDVCNCNLQICSFLGKMIKNTVIRKCQQHTSASFLEASQSGFTSGHRMETVFIATLATTNIEKTLILPYRAICRGAISHENAGFRKRWPCLWYLQCLVWSRAQNGV